MDRPLDRPLLPLPSTSPSPPSSSSSSSLYTVELSHHEHRTESESELSTMMAIMRETMREIEAREKRGGDESGSVLTERRYRVRSGNEKEEEEEEDGVEEGGVRGVRRAEWSYVREFSSVSASDYSWVRILLCLPTNREQGGSFSYMQLVLLVLYCMSSIAWLTLLVHFTRLTYPSGLTDSLQFLVLNVLQYYLLYVAIILVKEETLNVDFVKTMELGKKLGVDLRASISKTLKKWMVFFFVAWLVFSLAYFPANWFGALSIITEAFPPPLAEILLMFTFGSLPTYCGHAVYIVSSIAASVECRLLLLEKLLSVCRYLHQRGDEEKDHSALNDPASQPVASQRKSKEKYILRICQGLYMKIRDHLISFDNSFSFFILFFIGSMSFCVILSAFAIIQGTFNMMSSVGIIIVTCIFFILAIIMCWYITGLSEFSNEFVTMSARLFAIDETYSRLFFLASSQRVEVTLFGVLFTRSGLLRILYLLAGVGMILVQRMS